MRTHSLILSLLLIAATSDSIPPQDSDRGSGRNRKAEVILSDLLSIERFRSPTSWSSRGSLYAL